MAGPQAAFARVGVRARAIGAGVGTARPRAATFDPRYALAYTGLADSYILLGSFGVEPLGEVIPKARAAAVRAVEINERNAEAHAALVGVTKFGVGQSELLRAAGEHVHVVSLPAERGDDDVV